MDRKFTQLVPAGALAAADLLAIAQSPFGAGSSKSITGTVLASFITSTVTPALGAYLPLAGGTMVGNLLFSLDNTVDIGASLATRPRTGYFGTSVVAPLFTGALTGAASANVLKAGDTMTGNLIFSLDNTLDIGASLATRPRRVYVGTEVVAPLFTGNLTGTVTGGASLDLPLAGGTMLGSILFTDNSFDIGANGATRVRSIYAAGRINVQRSGLGASAVVALDLSNSTDAALGAQQFSPTLQLSGFGWGTTASTSQATDFQVYVQPIQAATATARLMFDVSLNGAAYSNVFLVTSGGAVQANGGFTSGASSWNGWNGRSVLASSANGLIELTNAAGTDFTQLNFGGTTSSFPAIARSTTFLDLVLADASGPAQLSLGKSAIGSTPNDALIVKNTTAAALGAQQFSPALRLQGFGWGTTVGTSQACDWRIYVAPTQSTVPVGWLNFDVSTAGAAFANKIQIAPAGTVYASGFEASGIVTAGATQSFVLSGRARLRSSADGIFELFNNGASDFTRLNFGGTTSSFPAISRSTTFLDLVLADASGPAQLSLGKSAIGVTPTDALIIKNTTAAALGAQQFSPALRLQGFGWGTTAGTSQACDWRIYVAPVQGLTPTNPLVFATSVAGAAFGVQMSVSTAGLLSAANLSSTGSIFATSASAKIFLASRVVFNSGADGVLNLSNSVETTWTRLNLGLGTNAFPALATSGTNIVLTLGDGTGNAGLTTGPLTTVSSQTHKYLGINGATVLDATHYCVNATANTFDVTLPTAVSVAGRTYVIKNSGTGVVTLKANGAETIDAVASWIINQYTSLTVMSDGANWILI